jgi:hypothetical protein
VPAGHGPAAVPASGAYVGASADYDHAIAKMGQPPSQPAQITVLEQDIGRTLDIDNNYYCFARTTNCDLTGNTATNSDAQFGRMPLDSWACSVNSAYSLSAITTGFAAWQHDPAGPQSVVIQYLIDQAKAVAQYGTTTFIRWAWEMTKGGANSSCVSQDGGASAYKQAWQAVYTIFHAYGASNAEFVWCPSAAAFSSADGDPLHSLAEQYYPGNAYVDYVCADGYDTAGKPATDFAAVFGSAYTFARMVARPNVKAFMVGETGFPAGTASQAAWIQVSLFREVQSSYPDVKAVLYWDSYNCGQHHDYTIGWPAGQATVPASVAVLRSVVSESYFNPRGLPAARPAANPMPDDYATGC